MLWVKEARQERPVEVNTQPTRDRMSLWRAVRAPRADMSSTWWRRLAVVPGVILLTVAVGIGAPHLAKDGWSTATLVGALAAAGGILCLVVAARTLRPVGWPVRVLGGLGTLLLLGLSLLTLGQALAVNWVPHAEVTRHPADVGLDADDIRFPTADGVELAGWYLPPDNGTAVILAHGAGSTRSAVLDHAALLADHGYGILAFDARGHGDSQGRAMDFGWWGDEDIGGAVDFLDGQPDVRHIAALGLSMGGEEALGALAADDRIEAVVAEGATVRVAGDRAWLSTRYGWRGQAQEWLESATTWFTDWFSPADPPISLRDAVSRAEPRPVLLIAAGEVPGERHAAEWIQSGAPGSVTVVEMPGAGHTAGLRTDAALWEQVVIDFLDEAVTP